MVSAYMLSEASVGNRTLNPGSANAMLYQLMLEWTTVFTFLILHTHGPPRTLSSPLTEKMGTTRPSIMSYM